MSISRFLHKGCIALLGICALTVSLSAFDVVYSVDGRDSLGRAVRILEQCAEDGTMRRPLLAADFQAENLWPGYRGLGPFLYDQPDVSWDGRAILFSNTYNLFLLDRIKGEVFTLTRFTREKYQPRFSPDGKRLAFVSDRNESPEIHTMDLDGGRLRNLSWSDSRNLSPTWAPDGTRLAFISDRDGNFALYTCCEGGLDVRRILRLSQDIREPDWGRNGEILFATRQDNGDYALCAVLEDGSGLRTLFTSPHWCGHASWRPDGQAVVFSSTASGSADVWILYANGRTRNLTNTPETDEYFPRWASPVPNNVEGISTSLKVDTEILDTLERKVRRTGALPEGPLPVQAILRRLPRPRLLFTQEQLPAIRSRLAGQGVAEPALVKAWRAFLAKCDGYLKSPQKVEESLTGIPANPLRTRYVIPAFAELYDKSPWLDAVFSLAFAFQVEQETLPNGLKRLLHPEYGAESKRILLKAARISAANGLPLHSDYRVACAFDWLYPLFSAEERRLLVNCLAVALERKRQTCLFHSCGIRGESPGSGNYAVYFSASLGPGALALAGESGSHEEDLDVGIRLTQLTLNRWIAPEGDAQEGFSYFSSPMEELMPFLVSLKNLGMADSLLDSNLKNIPRWMALSSACNCTETPALGDCDYLALRLPTGLLALYPQDMLLQALWDRVPRHVSALRTIPGLLWWRPATGQAPPLEGIPAAAVFPHTGYAVFRTGGREDAVLLVSAPRQAGHAHLEYGALSLTAFGRHFLRDPGQGVASADYHSQVLVNGRGRQRNVLPKSMLGALRSTAEGDGIGVDFTEAFASSVFGPPGQAGIPCGQPGLRQGVRDTLYVHSSQGVPPYFLVADTVRCHQQSQVEQLFTADAGMEIAPVNGGFRIAIPGEKVALCLVAVDGLESRARVVERQFRTRFHGQKLVTLPQLSLERTGQEVTFLTMLLPMDERTPLPKVEPGRLTWPAAVDEISVSNQRIEVKRQGNQP
ncbi:MAG: PD40 domain-containing protein [Victivallales bacterium]|nr:PD40 domain-containing protein [Victivallales bacterium]